MDEMSLEYPDCSRAVTEKEALHNLVSAVILNGVLEYRPTTDRQSDWG